MTALTHTRSSTFDPQKVLAQRTERLPSYSYKLTGGNQYGLDTAFSDVFVDEKRMSVRFCFADGNRRDGVGDLLEVGGIRTDRHRLNPLILFNHGKEVVLPIALAEDPDSKAYTVEIDPIARQACVTAFFYCGKGMSGVERARDRDHALFCEQLFDLISRKFVRGGSIGYQTVKALQLPPEYTDWQPAQPGLHLLVTLLLECSAVVLPANADTVLKCLAMPKICGQPPSPYLVKSLAPYAPPQTKTVVGYQKKQEEEEPKTEEKPKPSQATEEHPPPAQERARRGRTAGTMRQGNNEAFSLHATPFVLPEPSEGLKRLRSKYRTKDQPSDKINPKKARQILKDGTVNGQPLTEKQQAMFHAAAGREKEFDKYPYGKIEDGTGRKSNTPGLEAAIQRLQDRRQSHRAGCYCTWCRKARVMKTKTLSGVTQTAYAKDVPALRTEALRLLREYLNTDFEGHRERAWDALLESGLNLGNIPRTRAGAEQIINQLAQMGVKQMETKTKASPAPGDGASLPEDGGVHAEPDGDEEEALEPYGAQVLRSVHEDHGILMQEYDSLLQQVEQPKVRKLVEKVLQNLESTLTAIEKIFESDYAHLDGLDTGDGEEDGTPTPEEAVEGMSTKRLISLARKTLRQHYKNFVAEETTKVEVTKPSGPSDYTPGQEPMQQHSESIVPGGTQGDKGIGMGKVDSPGTDMGIEDGHTPGDEARTGSELVIHPLEHLHLKNIKDFLGEVAGAKDLDSEFSFKAYHYWKLLNPIQVKIAECFKGFPEMEEEDKNFVNEMASEVELTDPSGPSHYTPGQEPLQQHTESIVPGGTEGSKTLLAFQFYKTLNQVGVFLKGLCTKGTSYHELEMQKEAGVKGKALAFEAAYSKALEDFTKNFVGEVTTMVEVTKPAAQNPCSNLNSEPMQQHTESIVPGGAGVKDLLSVFQNQSNAVEDLRKRIAEIVNW